MNDDDPQQLRDNPAQIAAYLNHAFETDDLTTILGALHKVLRAQNVAALARATGLRRDSLYRTFGGQIEPDFRRVLKLLDGFDVQITIKPREVRKPKPPLPKFGRPKKRSSDDPQSDDPAGCGH
jgi:probable addiction module antidote protein